MPRPSAAAGASRTGFHCNGRTSGSGREPPARTRSTTPPGGHSTNSESGSERSMAAAFWNHHRMRPFRKPSSKPMRIERRTTERPGKTRPSSSPRQSSPQPSPRRTLPTPHWRRSMPRPSRSKPPMAPSRNARQVSLRRDRTKTRFANGSTKHHVSRSHSVRIRFAPMTPPGICRPSRKPTARSPSVSGSSTRPRNGSGQPPTGSPRQRRTSHLRWHDSSWP